MTVENPPVARLPAGDHDHPHDHHHHARTPGPAGGPSLPHSHSHSHSHAHGPAPRPSNAAKPAPGRLTPGFSLLRQSLAVRLAIAGGCSALIWAASRWAIG